MEKIQIKSIEGVLRLKMKEPHTLVGKWPSRLKLRPGQPEAKEEIDMLLVTSLCGQER